MNKAKCVACGRQFRRDKRTRDGGLLCPKCAQGGFYIDRADVLRHILVPSINSPINREVPK
jgi:DNA-directed RNA polymerase subunit RPC12/RpoP